MLHMVYMLCAVRPEIMCPKLFGNFPEYALARELEWFDLFHKCSITVYTLTKQYILCGGKHLTILPDFIFEQYIYIYIYIYIERGYFLDIWFYMLFKVWSKKWTLFGNSNDTVQLLCVLPSRQLIFLCATFFTAQHCLNNSFRCNCLNWA